MKQLSKLQCAESTIPLYQEEFIDWFVKSGKTKTSAKKYIQHFKNLYERVLKSYWKESALLLYWDNTDEYNEQTDNEHSIPDIEEFFNEIREIMDLKSPIFLTPAMDIASMCIEIAQDDLEKLKISKNTLNQWSSSYNTYIDFIKYRHETKVQEWFFNNSEDKHEKRLRSLSVPFIDEFNEWQKQQSYMGCRTKSNYISMLNDLHRQEFPSLDPMNASPFDLMMPFLPKYTHVAVDILLKYIEILRNEKGRMEHFSALNKYITFLNDKFGNTIDKSIDKISDPFPAALKYNLSSFKIKIFKKPDIMAYIGKEFQKFIMKIRKGSHSKDVTQEDVFKIMVMTENGFKKLSEVENMVVIPWQEYAAIGLHNDETFEVFTPNNEGDIIRPVVRSLNDLEVRLWNKWLVLAVKDFKQYPEWKYC